MLAALPGFLVDAKRRTYAAQGDAASIAPLLCGSKQLEYAADAFAYRDIYFGMAYFVGLETVYREQTPVWSMSYAGGVADTNLVPKEIGAIYAFLRQALRAVTPARPFRGPASFASGELRYVDISDGGLARFQGEERILRGRREVYRLAYAGGVIC